MQELVKDDMLISSENNEVLPNIIILQHLQHVSLVH